MQSDAASGYCLSSGHVKALVPPLLHSSSFTLDDCQLTRRQDKQVQQIDCISHVYAHSDGLKVRLPFALSLTHLVDKYYNFSDEHASISLMAQCVSKELAKDIWSVSCELNTASVIFSVR